MQKAFLQDRRVQPHDVSLRAALLLPVWRNSRPKAPLRSFRGRETGTAALIDSRFVDYDAHVQTGPSDQLLSTHHTACALAHVLVTCANQCKQNMDTAKFNEKKVKEAGKRTLAELQAEQGPLKLRHDPLAAAAAAAVAPRSKRPRQGRGVEGGRGGRRGRGGRGPLGRAARV